MSTIAERIKRMKEPSVFHEGHEVFVHRHYDGWTKFDHIGFVNEYGHQILRYFAGVEILLPNGKEPRLHVWETRRVRTMKREWDDDKLIHRFFVTLYPETKQDRKDRIEINYMRGEHGRYSKHVREMQAL